MGSGTEDGEEEELQEVMSGSWQSTTPPTKPMTHDKIYYYLPYWDDKPCQHVRSIWPDYRRRMYNSNIIGRIIDKLVRFSRHHVDVVVSLFYFNNYRDGEVSKHCKHVKI